MTSKSAKVDEIEEWTSWCPCVPWILNFFYDNTENSPTLSKSKAAVLKAQRENCLKAHNYYRAKHGVPKLTLDNDITEFSQCSAIEYLKRNTITESKEKSSYGTNIYKYEHADPTYKLSAIEAVEKWYQQILLYDFKSSQGDAKTSNFTQVIWKSTTHLGVGIAKDGKTTVIVCHYKPPGNVKDKYKDNVPALLPEPEPKPVVKKQVGPKLSPQIKNCIQTHNEFRAKHGCPPLKFNPKISKFSQRWADHLMMKGLFKHSVTQKFGENLHVYNTTDLNYQYTGKEGVTAWYDEIKSYDFKNPKFTKETGHFTQLIWKDTKELGIGIAQKNGKFILVCNYRPPGNVEGEFEKNVPNISNKK